MSENSLDDLQNLIAKAAMEPAFRDALLADPIGAAKGIAHIDLALADVETLKSIEGDLKRFGDTVGLNVTDAKIWAVGVIVTSAARAQDESWTVNLTSLPRRRAPKKGWNVAVTSIPRKRSPKENWDVAVTSIPRKRSPKENRDVAVTSIARRRVAKKKATASKKARSKKPGRSK